MSCHMWGCRTLAGGHTQMLAIINHPWCWWQIQVLVKCFQLPIHLFIHSLLNSTNVYWISTTCLHPHLALGANRNDDPESGSSRSLASRESRNIHRIKQWYRGGYGERNAQGPKSAWRRTPGWGITSTSWGGGEHLGETTPLQFWSINQRWEAKKQSWGGWQCPDHRAWLWS